MVPYADNMIMGMAGLECFSWRATAIPFIPAIQILRDVRQKKLECTLGQGKWREELLRRHRSPDLFVVGALDAKQEPGDLNQLVIPAEYTFLKCRSELQHESTYMHCTPSPVLKVLAPVDADFGYLRFLMAAQNCVSQVIGSLSDLVSSAASAKSR